MEAVSTQLCLPNSLVVSLMEIISRFVAFVRISQYEHHPLSSIKFMKIETTDMDKKKCRSCKSIKKVYVCMKNP